MDRQVGPNFKKGMQGSMDHQIGSYFWVWMQESIERQIGPYFKIEMQGSIDRQIELGRKRTIFGSKQTIFVSKQTIQGESGRSQGWTRTIVSGFFKVRKQAFHLTRMVTHHD